MLRHPLDGSYAKAERARENLRALYDATEAFLKSDPYAIAIDDNPKSGKNTVFLRAERAPLRLSAIAGDFIHDLRSALDHAIWQLVISNRGTPGRHNQFPIYTDEGDFIRDVVDRAANRGPGPLDGIDPDGPAWAFVEGEQPYQRRHPEMTVLRHLRTLSNLDKHQTLVPALGVMQPVDIQSILAWNPEAILLEQHFESSIEGPIEGRTDLAWLRFDPDGPEPQVDVKGSVTLHITFGERDHQLSRGALSSIRVGVAVLIGQLEEFF